MRPEAKYILLFDVLSDVAVAHYAQRDPDAFKRRFKEEGGRVGLELLSTTAERMKHAGLEVGRVVKFGTTRVQNIPSYRWLDAAYGANVPRMQLRGRLAASISKGSSRSPAELAVTAFDFASDHITLPDQATRAVVLARRVVH
jgi:hypothetical protein